MFPIGKRREARGCALRPTFKYAGVIPNQFVEIEMLGCPGCGAWFAVDTAMLESAFDIYCVSCGFKGQAPEDNPEDLTQERLEELIEWGNQIWENNPALRDKLLGTERR